MDSRKDEKGKHQAEIKFKTEERKTRFADGKIFRQGLSEVSYSRIRPNPLGQEPPHQQ